MANNICRIKDWIKVEYLRKAKEQLESPEGPIEQESNAATLTARRIRHRERSLPVIVHNESFDVGSYDAGGRYYM
jgi:hypothetical protein